MKHVVRFTLSERGWGTESWHIGYDTIDEAIAAEHDTNSVNTLPTVPSTYTRAKYLGLLEVIPEDDD